MEIKLQLLNASNTVRGSNSSGADFHTVQTAPGAHTAPYTVGTGSLVWAKRQKREVKVLPHLAPRVKKG